MAIPESSFPGRATRGGLVDDVGGVGAVILAIVGLLGLDPPILAVVATILLGVTLLIQGKAMLAEHGQFSALLGAKSPINAFDGASRWAVILLGAGGMILGLLALLDFESALLTPAASIMFGAALIASSVSAWRLSVARRAIAGGKESLRDILSKQILFDAVSIQVAGGLAAIVLGVLALSGAKNDLTFNLVALLVLGSALVLKGGALNAILLGFMRSAAWRSPDAASVRRQ
ncbi:MAG: hypothetical protein AB7F41_13255 [Methylocystis sp.]|uniref:hypothetical protein n=1 Tax=Methylocystis sp. TaxID=1911079 RepID=UPI003D128492